VIRPDELVVVDLGASIDGYCSDMTRTFSTGDLSRRQSEIYHIVREAQDVALQAARPGVTCAELDGMARRHITGSGYGDAFGHSLVMESDLKNMRPGAGSQIKEILMAGMTVTIDRVSMWKESGACASRIRSWWAPGVR